MLYCYAWSMSKTNISNINQHMITIFTCSPNSSFSHEDISLNTLHITFSMLSRPILINGIFTVHDDIIKWNISTLLVLCTGNSDFQN